MPNLILQEKTVPFRPLTLEQAIAVPERDPSKNQKNNIEKTFPADMPEGVKQKIREWNVVTKSPFSDSYYDITNKSWTDNFDGFFRISDHWNIRTDDGETHAKTDKVVPPKSWVLAKKEGNLYTVIQTWPKDFAGAVEKRIEKEQTAFLAQGASNSPRMKEVLGKLLSSPASSSSLFAREDTYGRKHIEKLTKIGIIREVNAKKATEMTNIPGLVLFAKEHPKARRIYYIAPEHTATVAGALITTSHAKNATNI